MSRSRQDEQPRTSEAASCIPRTFRIRERQKFNVSSNAEDAENDDVDLLDVLLKQTWTIFGVSALFGFHQDELHFKQYGKRLREELANSLSLEDVTYDAKFSFLKDELPDLDSDNPSPVKIEVNAKTTGREKNVEKSMYKGIFISWKATRTELSINDCVRLPLLLCRGARSCMDAVHSTLSKMFDCMVVALPATEDDLMWLLPIVITPGSMRDKPKANAEVKLQYIVPGLSARETITIKMKIKDLVNVLSVINPREHENSEVSLYIGHIEKFYEILYTQMLDIASLQIGLCTLHRIDLPDFIIMDNKMKAMNLQAMNRVLLYLNEKALSTLHTF